jgi:hypothetical protein
MKDVENNDIFEDVADDKALADALNRNIEREIALAQSDENPFVFSKQHNVRMRKLLKMKEHRRSWVHIRRAVMAAAAILVLVNIALLTVPGVRTSVNHAFVDWFSPSVNSGEQSSAPPTDNQGGTLVTPLAAYHPTYIPLGYTLTSKESSKEKSYMAYANAEGKTLELTYAPEGESILIGHEGEPYTANYETKTENGITYYFIVYTYEVGEETGNVTTITVEMPIRSVMWSMDNVNFLIEGEISNDELLMIAQSLKKI